MKNIKIFLLLICLGSYFSCYMMKGNSLLQPKVIVPGCVWIAGDLYADKVEVSNIAYKEYQYWVFSVFGNQSDQYLKTLLDTSVWNSVPQFEHLSKTYHTSRDFDDFPVVGISYEQAVEFTRWRTDRVTEGILIRNGFMQPRSNQGPNDFFQLSKYIDGDNFNLSLIENAKNDRHFKEIQIPLYDLPSIAEWEKFAALDRLDLSKWKESLHQTNVDHIVKQDTCPTMRNNSTTVNTYGLAVVIGNVSEMTKEKGVCKGDNWKRMWNDVQLHENHSYTSTENWLGFRNVCTLKTYKIK